MCELYAEEMLNHKMNQAQNVRYLFESSWKYLRSQHENAAEQQYFYRHFEHKRKHTQSNCERAKSGFIQFFW